MAIHVLDCDVSSRQREDEVKDVKIDGWMYGYCRCGISGFPDFLRRRINNCYPRVSGRDTFSL